MSRTTRILDVTTTEEIIGDLEDLLAKWENGADAWGTCSHEWMSLAQMRLALRMDDEDA